VSLAARERQQLGSSIGQVLINRHYIQNPRSAACPVNEC
jgi:hypothetical protein